MTAPVVRVVDPALVGSGRTARLRAYLALTKPRIIELLLITTLPAMVVAAGEWPGTWLVVATLVGGAMSAGGANAINNVVDRDIDRLMGRTARRPIPAARVAAGEALALGVGLGVAGFAWLWAFTNLLAAALATAALLFYVLIYTMLLKRSTSQNIVIGGAAGAVPVLVGWAAVTGSLALPAWIMFAVVFFWTPPHFWALSMRYRADYARAGVPMLPVIVGDAETARQIFLYAVAVLGVSLLLYPVVPMGLLYLAGAVLLGVAFAWQAWRLQADHGRAMTVFTFSNVYLAALFVLMAADVLVT